MDVNEIRSDCLKLAYNVGYVGEDAIKEAQKFSDFIINEVVPKSLRPTPDALNIIENALKSLPKLKYEEHNSYEFVYYLNDVIGGLKDLKDLILNGSTIAQEVPKSLNPNPTPNAHISAGCIEDIMDILDDALYNYDDIENTKAHIRIARKKLNELHPLTEGDIQNIMRNEHLSPSQISYAILHGMRYRKSAKK